MTVYTSKHIENINAPALFRAIRVISFQFILNPCCNGRVVKALDLKCNGIFPHRFEPCSQRRILIFDQLLWYQRCLFESMNQLWLLVTQSVYWLIRPLDVYFQIWHISRSNSNWICTTFAVSNVGIKYMVILSNLWGTQGGELVSSICMKSGWPSGLRRQTQGPIPCPYNMWYGLWEFWSTNVGVGSNPTSDTYFEY